MIQRRRRAAGPLRAVRAVRRTPRLVVAVALVGFVAVAALVGLGLWDRGVAVTAQEEQAATQETLEAVADPLAELCAADPDVRARVGVACGTAAQVVADPAPTARDGRDAPPPSSEQIQAAVAAELARNPPPRGEPPTAAEVAAAVAQYLLTNPPAPGRPPTAAEIAAEVATFFERNPTPEGPEGEPGRAPTPEEIRAAVAAELAANPPQRGQPGAQGVGVDDIRAEERDGACVLVFVLLDPSDGSTTEQIVQVAPRVCADGGLLG